MSDELSARAQAILEAAERAAAAQAAQDPAHGAPPPRPVSPSPVPQPHAPRQDWSRPVEPASIPATAPGQLLAIVDQVMTAAEAARRRLDELSATLDELTRRVDAAGRSGPAAASPVVPPADTSLRARPRPPARQAEEPRPAGDAPADGLAATAKLIAVEMAVAGASRMEVDRRLRDQLGMPTTHEVLDEVFGAGSAPSARLS